MRPFGPIVPTRGFGDPRAEAREIDARERAAAWRAAQDERSGAVIETAPHGLPREYIDRLVERFETFHPKAAHASGWNAAASFFDGMLPEGAALSPGAGGGYTSALHRTSSYGQVFDSRSASIPGADFGSGNVMMQPQRPYYPELDSQDRQSYPVHRQQANMYWRLFYKLDPVVGQGIEMYSQLPWGEFQLTGDGVDGEIKAQYERQIELTRLKSMLPYFVSEFLVCGEVAPHLFYSELDGIYTFLALHNPDFLDVLYVPTLHMDPIVQFRPDPKLRQLITSAHPMAADVRATMPPELIAAVQSGQPIPLLPPNFSLIARRLHPYDVRGTSILARMWRAFMYEDGIFNASIATARRHAGPIKVAKIGDPATGVIPGNSVRDELLRVLAQCEIDPHAWLVWHYGIQFDLVGSTERVLSIDKSWDIVERIKLIAMGISKALLHGEVSYASAASGLSIFLRKLKSLRVFFENEWLYPRFFRQVAETNGWVKRSAAELAHGVRIQRTAQELAASNAYIVPRLEWEQSLNPSVDSQMISALRELHNFGVDFSQQTLLGIVGRDWEKELRQRGQEAKRRKEILEEYPELAEELARAEASEGGGDGGGGFLPGLGPDVLGGGDAGGLDDGGLDDGGLGPPGDLGGAPPELPGGEPPPVEGAAAPTDGRSPSGRQPSDDPVARTTQWSAEEVADFQAMLRGAEPEVEPWVSLAEDLGGAPRHWREVSEWLYERGYPDDLVRDLQALLKRATAPRSARRRAAATPPRPRIDARVQLAREARRLLDDTSDVEALNWIVGAGNLPADPSRDRRKDARTPSPGRGGRPRR